MKAVAFLLILATATTAFAKIYFPETPLDAGMRRRPKIVGGVEAKPNSIPYQVGIFLGNSFCGGSLITKRFVLTAAHCLRVVDEPLVVLGAHEVMKNEDTQVVMKVKSYLAHEKFGHFGLDHDIGVVELPSDAPLNKNIQTIKLACPHAGLFVNWQATVSGWGRAYANSSSISPVLRVVTSNIMTNKDCQRKFGFRVSKTVVCLDGSAKKGSCNGDSGGPLVVKSEDGTLAQIGVVSYGSSAGCEKGFPTAYTRVTSYFDWVSNHTDYKAVTY